MPHLRSKEALARRQQKRDARQYVFSTSYVDYQLAETVCTVNTRMILSYLQEQHDGVDVQAVNVECGEVLLDSRGRGSFQNV